MESWSREHAARMRQVPRLAWVMARAYAPDVPVPLRVLWVVGCFPAYLLVVWWGWGTQTLVARPDGLAMFTLTPAGGASRRGMVAIVPLLVAIVPLLVVYTAGLSLAAGWVEAQADVNSAWASFVIQAGVVVLVSILVLVPLRPWTLRRNRAAKAAVTRHLADAEMPHWEAAALAAWPPGYGYGVELLEEVLVSLPATGTVWLVARDLWLVPIYERFGCEVVEGSGGRGLVLRLAPRG